MTIADVVKVLNGKLMAGDAASPRAVGAVVANDLMSDVLAFVKEQAVLLTGLVNLQVVRTAEMMDMKCIVFVRGKKPGDDVIELACESGIVMLSTDERMYVACGKLYENGLRGGSVRGS